MKDKLNILYFGEAVHPSADMNEHTALTAQQVMHRISEDVLKPIPAVFSVLFAHYSNSNPDISRHIHLMEQQGKSLTTSFCEDIYKKYISTETERDFIDEATRKMQAVVSEISEIIRSAGTVHKEYNKNLIRQSDTLSAATSLEEIKMLVATLVTDTRKVVEENHQLESKLLDSSEQLQQMRQDIHTLQKETLTDSLTGIANRKAFDTELKKCATESVEKSRPLSLIMIDIDHFKVFNDTYGHQVGDQVLRLVAKTLAEGLRGAELLARYGGEEFSVLVSGAKLRDAEKLADKLRGRIAAKDIINHSKNEKMGRLSVSLGVAQFHPGEALTELIDRADRALYKAKDAGRNKYMSIEYDKLLHDKHARNIVIDENQ